MKRTFGYEMKDKPIITRIAAKRRLKEIFKGLKELEKKVPKEKMRIIDVGCGNGYFTRAIEARGYDVTGIDSRGPNNAQWIHHKPDYIMDARKMTFKDNSFDAAIALEVVEHVDCIPEINRILKPGGFFFCSTPAPGTDWVRHIVVFLGILEDQDFEHHDFVQDLRKAPMKLLKYKKMLFWTSQFGVFTKK